MSKTEPLEILTLKIKLHPERASVNCI